MFTSEYLVGLLQVNTNSAAALLTIVIPSRSFLCRSRYDHFYFRIIHGEKLEYLFVEDPLDVTLVVNKTA